MSVYVGGVDEAWVKHTYPSLAHAPQPVEFCIVAGCVNRAVAGRWADGYCSACRERLLVDIDEYDFQSDDEDYRAEILREWSSLYDCDEAGRPYVNNDIGAIAARQGGYAWDDDLEVVESDEDE